MSVWQEKLPHSETWLIGVSGRLDQSLNPKLEETLNDLDVYKRQEMQRRASRT